MPIKKLSEEFKNDCLKSYFLSFEDYTNSYKSKKIIQSEFNHFKKFNYNAELIQNYDKNKEKEKRIYCYVLNKKNKAVSFVILREINDKYIYIAYVFTNVKYRNKGYAKKLLYYISKVFKKDLYLISLDSSKNFYKKIGFKENKKVSSELKLIYKKGDNKNDKKIKNKK